MNEEMKTPAANGKLSTIFLVVLGLHVAVIVAFIAYNLLKGNTESVPEIADTITTEETGTIAESAELPAPAPALDTEANPVAEAGSPQETPFNNMSMPAPTDPIYSNSTVIQTRPLDTAATVPMIESPKPVATTNMSSYTVKKGDSLAKIARIHNTTVPALREANAISGDMIKIGQSLQIPGMTSNPIAAQVPARNTTVPVALAVNSTAPVKSGFSEYTVAAGDTLWKIAKIFNTQPSQIAKMNGITDPSKLKVGSTIKVPTSSSQEASAPKAEPVRTNVQNQDVAMIPQTKRQ